ncbi:4-hydroxy-tetrahydrodipicolinate synthase [Phascolarctobacterium succinatutens]|jgi:dihydrodipicolinate synthase|uniref:4-hydroxy-tetrahydrodipicolinate synthase n=1 Tax=Phascolarctobacterium succinatutens YIT 12067 TaxID=626939 RepID=E8LCS1_9FIRM|nr:4-hydroxy-tetrahydrodipicolinate synthase [Phascolarctobacterium succinatutens]EFY05374.1 dihydrodipicolinate synthase [Phascolarctobacterium succinatutens YIT 12067]MEE0356957.1 4-hydroxy-tetrahydrodipicolinate synthase [Phascolarctobacterium succinatutens]UQT41064.1 4-hydroxy-tetrahydrodipicolinate synthase [Phascolarctobacterium succinatutens]
MKKPYFGRLLTAMVTPFNADGSVNYAAGADFADWLLANGSDGLVVEGSTGEAATMDMDEKIKFMQTIVARVNGRAKIVAGAGTNCTASTIDLVKKMEACGVDGVLVVGPYYNKPTQEGYYQHFAAVAKATKLPIIVYNVPGRTGGNIAPETVARLAADFSNIVAIKEAAGNVAQTAELYRVLPEDFSIYSGDDGLILPFMSVGACGLISVLANVNGNLLQQLMQAYSEGRVKDAADLNKVMVPLAKAMFIESNPIPIKAAVTKVTGIEAGAPRLPLTPISAAAEAKLDAALKAAGMIR